MLFARTFNSRTVLGPLALTLQLALGACARLEGEGSEDVLLEGTSQAMMDDGSIDCSNCMGGDCATLHCFEDWTHGGGGGGGGGGGVGGGPYSGPGQGYGGDGLQCHYDVVCRFDCNSDVNSPCYNDCVDDADGNFGSRAFRACKKSCDAAYRACTEDCRICE